MKNLLLFVCVLTVRSSSNVSAQTTECCAANATDSSIWSPSQNSTQEPSGQAILDSVSQVISDTNGTAVANSSNSNSTILASTPSTFNSTSPQNATMAPTNSSMPVSNSTENSTFYGQLVNGSVYVRQKLNSAYHALEEEEHVVEKTISDYINGNIWLTILFVLVAAILLLVSCFFAMYLARCLRFMVCCCIYCCCGRWLEVEKFDKDEKNKMFFGPGDENHYLLLNREDSEEEIEI
ncbi:hypothetical protein HDE_10715 [Halotydeus destructor]|nr:hypothetical protein HDE_10715 [Halotydeus destructor]